MNIYDIAAEADVSITTVSRVLNKHPNVSTRTRQRVLSVLEKYDYHPNQLARGLVTKSTHTIGVLTVDVRDAQYANEAYIIEQESEKLGYSVLLCNTGGDPDTQIRYMKLLLEKRVDGIILVGSIFNDSRIDEGIRQFAHSSPIMMINGSLTGPNIFSVFCDNGIGMRRATEHLLERGKTQICYIQDTFTYSGYCKVDGYRAALKDAGLPVEERRHIKIDHGLDGGRRAVDSFIERKIPFNAIMAGEDITALGALKRLQTLGYRIPEDVAVVGFNNSIFSQCAEPELTTVDTQMYDRLSLAVRLLYDVLNGKAIPPTTLFIPQLLIKGSS